MKAGDVILIALPQGDGRAKIRPAILLRQLPGYGDWLVCGVSSKLHQALPYFDEVIQLGDEDFVQSGLLTDSVIRLAFLSSQPSSRIPGVIGSISQQRLSRLLHRLADFLVAPLS
jgi:mRNA interferase MazF